MAYHLSATDHAVGPNLKTLQYMVSIYNELMSYESSDETVDPIIAVLRRADRFGSAWYKAHLSRAGKFVVDVEPRELLKGRFRKANLVLARLAVRHLLVEPAGPGSIEHTLATPVGELDQPLHPSLSLNVSLQRYESSSIWADLVEVPTGIETKLIGETGRVLLRFVDLHGQPQPVSSS